MARPVNSYVRPLKRWLGAVALTLMATGAAAQINSQADVQFGSASQTDPHPTTYTWDGKKEPVLEPGNSYFVFYYTGTVNPDARVPEDVIIERIAVPMKDWETSQKWLTAKLKSFYETTKNLPLNSLRELSGEAPISSTIPNAAPNGAAATQQGMGMGMQQGMPGDPNMGMMDPSGMNSPYGAPNAGGYPGAQGGMSPYGQPQGGYPQQPGQMMGQPGMGQPMGMDASGQMGQPGQPGPMGQPGMDPNMMDPTMTTDMMASTPGNLGGAANALSTAAGFNTQAAAEWTIYYDQLVLWQYYCARQLLNKMDQDLLEQGAADGEGTTGTPGAAGTSTTPGVGQRNQVGVLEMLSAAKPGEAGKSTLSAIKKRTTRPSLSGQSGSLGAGSTLSPMGGPAGDPMSADMPMGAPATNMTMGAEAMMGDLGNLGGPAQAGVREAFSPWQDFLNSERVDKYRQAFQSAAEEKEQDLYNSFIEMINRIDQRELAQERYNQWVQDNKKELGEFAENWRKVDSGETFMLDDTLYLVTKEPLESVPINGVNVLKGDQLTPQDLLNEDGSLKKPKID